MAAPEPLLIRAGAGWRPIRRLRTHEQVLAAIEEQILERNLRVGDRLPSERELADTYEVAVGTIRQALDELRRRGLVATLAAKGTFVTGDS